MSHEVTDEMIRAGARVYLHEVFYPEDIAYEEWGKASELTRKVLEAALSAAPTRARKPGGNNSIIREITLDDAAKIVQEYHLSESGCNEAMLTALQHIGAVVPDTAQGASGQQAQPE